ncbi:MAG: hypothetical protein ACPHN2_01495 [Sinimarinibacterium flocculans]|uniref:hypothetical protein n=1 Tax=Sinimarinibacterium flocculans TaxID=985250 RepID=UPI003C60E04C
MSRTTVPHHTGKPLRASHQFPGRRDDYGDWKHLLDLVHARLLAVGIPQPATLTLH